MDSRAYLLLPPLLSAGLGSAAFLWVRETLPGLTGLMGAVSLLLGFLLDVVVGDPSGWPHPVIVMGRIIALAERRLNSGAEHARKAKGVGLALILAAGSYALTWGFIRLADGIQPGLGWVIQVLLIASTLAGKSLLQAGTSVLRPLQAGDLVQARKILAGFVSRDTTVLKEGEVVRATVETLAENFVDGILSPLFYAALGGAPLAMAFKAVSTLDSMVGYRNERYASFGWFSARADDWANYLPARLSVLILVSAGAILGLDVQRAQRCWRRDAKTHPSPNGGYPESVVAGLLGIKLGGMNIYHGKPSFRAEMGEAVHPLTPRDILLTVSLVRLATWLSLIPVLILTTLV